MLPFKSMLNVLSCWIAQTSWGLRECPWLPGPRFAQKAQYVVVFSFRQRFPWRWERQSSWQVIDWFSLTKCQKEDNNQWLLSNFKVIDSLVELVARQSPVPHGQSVRSLAQILFVRMTLYSTYRERAGGWFTLRLYGSAQKKCTTVYRRRHDDHPFHESVATHYVPAFVPPKTRGNPILTYLLYSFIVLLFERAWFCVYLHDNLPGEEAPGKRKTALVAIYLSPTFRSRRSCAGEAAINTVLWQAICGRPQHCDVMWCDVMYQLRKSLVTCDQVFPPSHAFSFQ